MENKEKYHGSPLNENEYKEALQALGLNDDFEACRERRKGQCTWKAPAIEKAVAIDPGAPFYLCQ